MCRPPPNCSNQATRDVRTLGLYLRGPNALGPYGGEPLAHDALTTAANLAKYMEYCGAVGRGSSGRHERSNHRAGRSMGKWTKTRPVPTGWKRSVACLGAKGVHSGWSWI